MAACKQLQNELVSLFGATSASRSEPQEDLPKAFSENRFTDQVERSHVAIIGLPLQTCTQTCLN